STRLVHISTVAVYGHRDWKHPWARMGDPVLISAYDYYGASKALGERAVLESDIENWVVLRQTGTLHKKFMTNNLNDGLMFHTVWNGPLEWVTDTDSGRLIQHLIEKELRGELNGFWKNDYNICGGTGCRETGYDTFKAGFALMGATPEQFFRPHWNIPRNFHGVWYTDSDELNGWLDYQREDIATFWKQMQKRCWYYKGGKIVPAALLRKIVIERLLSNSNAPLKWVRSNDTGRIQAFFESKEKFDAIPTEWEHYPLLIHNRTETGMIDYGALLQSGDNPLYVLDHGYDESKPTTELSLADMQQAAQFRGGTCTSTAMTTGDLFTPLAWKCHNGHEFTARPFTIIRAGYWCPHCCMPPRWTYDQEVPHIPFYAQVYYDTHSVEESNRSYPLSEGDR
ncbi:MAG: NAD(P)-dependent oxidoreductase, partial [Treponema sp.]|nr:NAD(P)-dependent oxidoreductase [Treponema sp.]